jgi:hypothetical protein
MQNNPQLVFERLFGDGATEAQRQERRAKSASLLDSIREQVANLNRRLPAADQARLSEYLQEVREIERRVQLADARLSAKLDLPEKPIGIPRDFETHTALMFDLQVLAYKAEITRISSLMLSRENSNVVYPNSGVTEGFHNASHHSNERANMERFALINRYHVGILRRFIEKLAATPDGDGTLLDHSILLYGSNMSDSDLHNQNPLPSAVFGLGGGTIRGGQHLRYPDNTPLANLLLTLLIRAGVPMESFADSTGELTEV